MRCKQRLGLKQSEQDLADAKIGQAHHAQWLTMAVRGDTRHRMRAHELRLQL